MPTFQNLQNLVLYRLRQRGVNYGAAPGNSPTDAVPSALLADTINAGYSEFLSRTIEAQIATLKTSFLTTANATSYPLRPLPNTPGGAANPAVMRVLEATYTTATGGQNAGYEYEIALVSTQRFQALSGDYTRRLSWFGPRVEYAARLFRRPFLEVLPGTATAGDTISVTIVPDPANSPVGLAAASGGPLSAPGDVPLFPLEFHMALVEYCVMILGDALDMGAKVAYARDRWEAYVQRALEEGATEDGGDPMMVVDRFAGGF